jgi:hypothetical protein
MIVPRTHASICNTQCKAFCSRAGTVARRLSAYCAAESPSTGLAGLWRDLNSNYGVDTSLIPCQGPYGLGLTQASTAGAERTQAAEQQAAAHPVTLVQLPTSLTLSHCLPGSCPGPAAPPALQALLSGPCSWEVKIGGALVWAVHQVGREAVQPSSSNIPLCQSVPVCSPTPSSSTNPAGAQAPLGVLAALGS